MQLLRPLRQHQEQALKRFERLNEAAFLWEMGTGKTTAAIIRLRQRYQAEQRVCRTLIIAPVVTLYNWRDEFALNAPPKVCDEVLVPYMRTKKTKYTSAERAILIKESGKKIIVLNPESLDSPKVWAALMKFSPECIVIDEAHRFKAAQSKRFKGLLYITDQAQHRTLLTGTPILNSYLDIWAQWRILDKGQTFGTSFYTFRDSYFIDANASWRGMQKYFPKYEPREGTGELISEMIALKADRKTKDECLDLPDQIFVKREVELSPEQQDAYDEMESELITELKTGVCDATNALSRTLRLLQIVSGYAMVDAGQDEKIAEHFKTTPRLEILAELLEDLTPNHKVIVWSTFQENYAAISKLCQKMEIPFAELTGRTKNRQEEIDRFQTDPLCRVMIANPSAGGIGVNLTASDVSIYYSRGYSLGDRLQSLARNHRGGSEIHKRILVVDLVASSTLETDVLEALLRKESYGDNVLGRLKQRYESANH